MRVRLAIGVGIVAIALMQVVPPGCRFPVGRYAVAHEGMYPTFEKGENVILRRDAYGGIEDVERGDVVIYRQWQGEEAYDHIWRVVAVAGDHVHVEGDRVWVNDRELERSECEEEGEHEICVETNGGKSYEVAYSLDASLRVHEDVDIDVPPNSLFLMGDNRDDAADSRFHDAVNFQYVLGRVRE